MLALTRTHFLHTYNSKLSQAIKDSTDAIQTQVHTIQSKVDKIQQDNDDASYRKLLEWVSPTDYPAQQSDIIKCRQEGTGQWFLEDPKTIEWFNKKDAILFCPGVPGSGKTMVAAIVIDHLLNTAQSSESNKVGIAYVFCNYKAQEEKDPTSLLAAILKQLTRPSNVQLIEKLRERYTNRGTKPSLDEILKYLSEVLQDYGTVYIVVDALDECQDSNGTRRQFLAKLRDLKAGRDVRLMTTSRFYIQDIEDEFKEAMRLEVQASDEDVKRFVAGQLGRLPKCIQRDRELQKRVEEVISKAVDGMLVPLSNI